MEQTTTTEVSNHSEHNYNHNHSFHIIPIMTWTINSIASTKKLHQQHHRTRVFEMFGLASLNSYIKYNFNCNEDFCPSQPLAVSKYIVCKLGHSP